ncbi:hypothetical protein AMATHDRAFT_142267 [Amanita thiersii Skay4041]|uniref:Enoyl reductase (ER) domain-containing protein n=1 Tax=Amanita thiersii Skay4041 TaxID=703135 RepID=A0A2A9NV11_9AGAR|nr:hypothetical protein AMATHDRAFT_142267 [Amanita thiersii Skay4041]
MRAFLVKELAHPSKLRVQNDVPEPVVGQGQILIDVYSAGLNFFDILQAQGKHQSKPPLPFILGTEFSGRVSANSPIPDGCSYKPGDRVFGAVPGSFADKVVVDWTKILSLPDTLTFEEGAGLFITWPTSYEALVGRAELKAGAYCILLSAVIVWADCLNFSGETVLVTGAAGGVGICAVQIAKALGAKVIAAASSEAKLDIARKYGEADHGIDYSKPGWQKEVLRLTNNKGVDIIYDPVGLIKDCLKCIAWKGRALVIGFAGGTIETIPMNIVLLKNISIMGLHWGAYSIHDQERVRQVWTGLLELLASGKIHPVVYGKVYPLEDISEGLAAIERRETWGKAVIKVQEDLAKARM